MSRLRRMDLDFAAARDAPSWSGIVALAGGAAVCALVVLFHQQVLERVARLEAELGAAASARPAATGAAARGLRERGAAVAHANAVAHELSRRWDRVFVALESANAPDVAVLAIEPDTRKELVRVTAEAKGKNEMLDYVARLQSVEPLQRVLLESHEVLVQVPERPVRFTVSAAWEARP
jgi:hypothetical protein